MCRRTTGRHELLQEGLPGYYENVRRANMLSARYLGCVYIVCTPHIIVRPGGTVAKCFNVFIPDVLHIDDNVYRSPMLPLYLQSPSMLGRTQLGACCAVTTAASHSTSVSRGTSLLALAMPGRRGRDCSIPEAVQISQASQLLAG